MAKHRTYYSLLERIDGKWCPQFGDYDRETVAQERVDMHEGNEGPRMSNLKIIATDDSQAAIMAAVRKLNGEAE